MMLRVLRGMRDTAIGIFYITMCYWPRPLPGPSTAEIMLRTGERFRAEVEKQKLERMILEAQLVAEESARLMRRALWGIPLGVFTGVLAGELVFAWTR